MQNLIKNYLQNMLPNNQIQINLQFNKNIKGEHLIQIFQCTTKTPITQREAKELRENLNNIYAWEDNLDQEIAIRFRKYGEGTRITILNMLNF